MITINIAQEYSKYPGGRFIKEGPFSGEDFRESLLKPKYMLAKQQNEKIKIILDGGYGYGSSFLEESFGGLVRKVGKVEIDMFEIISEEEPQLISDIEKYITDELSKLEGK